MRFWRIFMNAMYVPLCDAGASSGWRSRSTTTVFGSPFLRVLQTITESPQFASAGTRESTLKTDAGMASGPLCSEGFMTLPYLY